MIDASQTQRDRERFDAAIAAGMDVDSARALVLAGRRADAVAKYVDQFAGSIRVGMIAIGNAAVSMSRTLAKLAPMLEQIERERIHATNDMRAWARRKGRLK